jgi:hypothetical protein
MASSVCRLVTEAQLGHQRGTLSWKNQSFQTQIRKEGAMNLRKCVTCLVMIAVLFFIYQSAGRAMVVKNILPPHAAVSLIVRNLLSPPYQMAVPHGGLLKDAWRSLKPVTSVCASGVTECDYTTAVATCNYGCGFCGHCPDCLKGPCTIYTCQDTTKYRLCEWHQGTGNCVGCENDSNVPCHRPGT